MVAPATTKVRQTKVNIEWFYDKNRKTWRFLPNDLSHQVTYDRVDSVTKTPLTPARTHENKGWVPAAMAIEMIPESRRTAPDVVKQRFASLFEAKANEAAARQAEAKAKSEAEAKAAAEAAAKSGKAA